MTHVQELVELLEGRTVYIQTHNFPDPDAIATAFGLQQLLAAKGVEATLTYKGSIDKLSSKKMLECCGIELSALSEVEDRLRESDAVVLVDAQKDNGNTLDITGEEVACIDHHPTFKKVEYQYFDHRIVGACASIVTSYWMEEELEIPAEVATALAYGIKMDTLQFSRGVTDFDIEMYGYLFGRLDSKILTALETNNMEFDDLRAYAAAIDGISVFDTTGFTYVEFPCPDAMVAILSDFILSLVEVETAIVVNRRKDGMKFSIRCERDDVDAGELAHTVLAPYGNGGGHEVMAGGFVREENLEKVGPQPYEALRSLFLEEVERQIAAAASAE